jgi:prophage regulatory protein
MSNNPIPETGYLRLSQIIGAPRKNPPIPPIIPVSRSCWLAGCKTGCFPSPVHLGPKLVVWKVEDIRALIDGTYQPDIQATSAAVSG